MSSRAGAGAGGIGDPASRRAGKRVEKTKQKITDDKRVRGKKKKEKMMMMMREEEEQLRKLRKEEAVPTEFCEKKGTGVHTYMKRMQKKVYMMYT